ncbi:MAG TPA: hypothetical protein VFX97_20545 [Pyrinomonadaceae bacterium]|nr:hypothetical protein [Pyrinomonadaceae bacterium]
MAELDPWDRQPGETSKAYEAFSIYRDMGAQRTVRRVAQHLNKSQQLINGWSGKNNWVARAAAFDSIPGRAMAEAYADMAADIAAQHRELSDKLMAKLSRNLDLLPDGADPTIRWSTAHGAARQGHALATDLVKPESKANDEINKAIENLLNKLAGE